MIHDENEYILLRRQLLTQPTTSEHARASRIASQMDYKNPKQSSDALVNTKLLKRKQRADSLYPIIVHYTYEGRFTTYKSTIHKIWTESFQRRPIITTKLIVGTRNNPNLTKELVRRSPHTPKRHK